MLEGGVWEVPPCCPCVQGGRGAPSACMVYRSSCRRRVKRTLGAVSSYTCVVWGRWRVTFILAASFLRAMVWGMM